MTEQRGWQERWGVADLEFNQVCVLIAAGFVLASPFFALANGDAGWLSFMVGFIVFWVAVMMTPDKPGSDEAE